MTRQRRRRRQDDGRDRAAPELILLATALAVWVAALAAGEVGYDLRDWYTSIASESEAAPPRP